MKNLTLKFVKYIKKIKDTNISIMIKNIQIEIKKIKALKLLKILSNKNFSKKIKNYKKLFFDVI